MGYKTYHELENDATGETAERLKARIESEEELARAIGEDHEWAKWYDHDRDMLALSKEFPDVTFILSGEGEESPDFWKTKYKDGKSFTAYGEIVYPVFGTLH